MCPRACVCGLKGYGRHLLIGKGDAQQTELNLALLRELLYVRPIWTEETSVNPKALLYGTNETLYACPHSCSAPGLKPAPRQQTMLRAARPKVAFCYEIGNNLVTIYKVDL